MQEIIWTHQGGIYFSKNVKYKGTNAYLFAIQKTGESVWEIYRYNPMKGQQAPIISAHSINHLGANRYKTFQDAKKAVLSLHEFIE